MHHWKMTTVKMIALFCTVLLGLSSYTSAARCRLKRIAAYPSDMVLIPPSEWDSLEIVKGSDTEGEMVRAVAKEWLSFYFT